MFPESLTEKELPVTLSCWLVTNPLGPWVRETLWDTCQLAMSELDAGELQVVLDPVSYTHLTLPTIFSV